MLLKKTEKNNLRKLGHDVRHSPMAVYLNRIIKEGDYTKFLEIGSDEGLTAEQITGAKVISVDPSPRFIVPFRYRRNLKLIKKYSDDFFLTNTSTFDLIFID